MNERSIFIAALEKQTSFERDAFLDEACGLDVALRRRIEHLLRSHVEAGTYLETPAIEALSPGMYAPPIGEGPGSRIGPYKLLQKLGEGGMGVVYMAEQERPVRRRVALKIIKPGMDSALVIARFEAERQALAMMDHVNIARVLDAGATEGGRPYFVMELVHGVPLTKYCDENHLTLRERLELFVPVCHAVQHAHHKGVIHRDLKPSNVLVTMYDGKPVPKVIDFGVAKATEQRLTERTLFTQYGVLVGTFEYMAPEQAEMSALGVDTRSDVYSLGVLLYELLTGTTPLDGERMKDAGLAEILRIVREQDPPAPSTRLSASAQALSAISERRRTEPQKLAKLVRGELDWIVMKCLEKDRTRRYETANGLARDVERHLNDEPVSASPPSRRYRLQKFARRNKALLGAAAAITVALVGGLGAATAGFVRARIDRDKAVVARLSEAAQRQAAQKAQSAAEKDRAAAERNLEFAKSEAAKAGEVVRFVRQMLAKGGSGTGNNPSPTVREVLDDAVKALDEGSLAQQGGVEGGVRQTIGAAYLSLGLLDAADTQLRAALSLQTASLRSGHPDIATTCYSLGALAYERKDYRTAAMHYREALDICRRAYGEQHTLYANTLSVLADVVGRTGDLKAADALHEQAVALNRKINGERSENTAISLHNRAITRRARRDYAGAEALYREAMAIYYELKGPGHRSYIHSLNNLAAMKHALGQDDPGVEKALREVIDYWRKIKPDHPKLLLPTERLHRLLARRGDPAAAAVQMDLLRLQAGKVTYQMQAMPADPTLPPARAHLYGRLGRFEEALADFELHLKLSPDDANTWFAVGIGRLYRGDVDGHRDHARRMLEKFGGDERFTHREFAAKVYLLSPPPSGGDTDETMKKVLSIAEQSVTEAEKTEPARVAWFYLTRAMAEFRAGKDAAALDWLAKFREASPKITYGDARHRDATGLALAAMAYHRLGHAEEARRSLEEAVRMMNGAPKPGEQDLRDGMENYQVYCIFLREAQALLGVQPGEGQARGVSAPAPATRPSAG
jgi:serine/threonine protein kinase